MTEQEFRRFVRDVLTDLFDQIDELDTDESDPVLSDGVVKVDFERGGTFVLSQQVPVQELWLSANRRAWHFRYEDGAWLERDSGEAMLPLLSGLFAEKLGLVVAFS
ncbi:MAG TPA: iron donor protein CyaY [Myxococcota bacterium]|nr:iron donor protein CyaY [Myxococcota bacterium]